MTTFLSPIGNDQVVDSNGAPLVGGYWQTFLAGTSTPVTTYTDSTGVTPQPSSITLDASGRPANPIWLSGGIPVKFRLSSAAGVVLLTVDNVSGINDPAGITAQDQWVLYGAAPTYLSATSFSLVGDQTNIFQIGRRIKSTNTGGIRYSSITNSVFGAVTTVTVTNDSGTLDSGMSAVSYGMLSSLNMSVPTTIARSGANADITSLNAPAIGAATATTAAQADSSTKVATTAFVQGVSAKIQPITASVATNALTLTINPTTLEFRSTTLGSGATTQVATAAISMVVSSGSTLGTVNAIKNRLVVLAINNAGTMEVAVCNIGYNSTLDETQLISTTAEGGAGAADSANTIYSTTARSNVAFRIVGYVESTQATAGTWATAPSLIQGEGGNAAVSHSSVGYNQAWTSVTRTVGTTYYNDTGRPITLNVSADIDTSFKYVYITVDGVNIRGTNTASGAAGSAVMAVIPPGRSYSWNVSGGTSSNAAAFELR